jgi:hypothetical protein
MALTATPLLIVLVILTAVMPAVVVWAWSQARGNRSLRIGQRVGMVLLAQLTALLLAGVALNDYGDFFSSWTQAADAFFRSPPSTALGTQKLGDLNTYGAPQAPAVTGVRGVEVRVAATDQLPAGLTPTRWSTREQYRSRGAVATMTLDGPVSQLQNTVAVYLPPAYFAGVRSLPLVEAITGYPSTYQSLAMKLVLPTRLLAGIRSGSMGQLVVVMTPAGLPYPLDSECTDAPGGPFAFTYFDKDVPQETAQVLGLAPTAFGALGYSTGGYCATKLAMLDPTRFIAAVSMSGYFHAQPGKYSPSMFGRSQTVRHINDLRWRLAHLPPPATSVLIMTGTEEAGADGWLTNNDFLEAVRPPMHAERYIVPVDFGHSYKTWAEEMGPALVWISRSLRATTGTGSIGSALFSRQGLVLHHRHRHPRVHPSAARTPCSTA